MDEVDDQLAAQVKRHLLKSRGVDMSGYTQSFVMRAIRKRVARAGADNLASYVKLLIRSEEETSELLNTLSINVTEFFRDGGAFEAFSAKAIRPLLQYKAATGGGILRIWSAGCATGQETYTISMCLADELNRMGISELPIMSITGTDISKAAVAKARKGVYSEAEVGSVPDKLLNKYFIRRGNEYEVSDSLRKGVRFHLENILDKPSSKFFDAIVCRNVLIYFSRTMHETVMANLHESLRLGGYLMIGRTEALIGQMRSRFEVIDQENRILRKVC
jgi:chemotaxis methyl-accepting protein methylase